MQKTFFTLFSALVACVLLAACATEINTKHIARMESFIGRPEKEVIMEWGVPDKTYQLDNRTKVISYRQTSYYNDGGSGFGVSTCAGSFPGSGIGYGGCIDPLPRPTRTYEYSCEYSFNIVEGKAVGWFQNGNSCPRIR